MKYDHLPSFSLTALDWEHSIALAELFIALLHFLAWLEATWLLLESFLSHISTFVMGREWTFKAFFLDFFGKMSLLCAVAVQPTVASLEATSPLCFSKTSFPTRRINTRNSHLRTSSKIQTSPILMSLLRTNAIHPPQKVWLVCTLVVGTEFTLQHAPLTVRRTISVLQFGRWAVENWYGIFCTTKSDKAIDNVNR